ncbi:MAG: hypothetical protein JW951_02000 [Lentisphaerae bacterium]|nr:hypothetical protein [Lentisphaerota bacterium]
MTRLPAAALHAAVRAAPGRSCGRLFGVLVLLGALAGAAPTNAPFPGPAGPGAAPTNVLSPGPAGPAVPAGRAGARLAQRLYRQGRYTDAAEAYLAAAREATPAARRDFRFNAAAAWFRAGRYPEAADVLRELRHVYDDNRPVTAAGLGSALYEAAAQAATTNAAAWNRKAGLMREAGEAFKEAARLDPANPVYRGNLAVIRRELAGLEEEARIRTLLDRYAQASLFDVADAMLRDQRDITAHAPSAFTNALPQRIEALERLARKQSDTADLLIPLKAKLAGAASAHNGGAAALEPQIETVRDHMDRAAAQLRDLEPAGAEQAGLAEQVGYTVWKALAPYRALLLEDMQRQTNAIRAATQLPEAPAWPLARREQADAAALTGLFTQRFSAAVPETGAVSPALTNAPPGSEQGISAEDRARILALAATAAARQNAAREHLDAEAAEAALTEQRAAYAALKKILELLPRQPQNQQQQQEQEQKQQDPRDADRQPSQEDRRDEQDAQDRQPPQPEPQQQEQEPEPQEPAADRETEAQPPENEAEALKLMEKALQREQEYREEKRRRERRIPLPPGERDW